MDAAKLDGKIAVVTGGGVGLGRAVAGLLADAGVRVAIFGRTRETLERASALSGGRLVPVVADISVPDQVRAGFAEVERRFGGLDILVNNAAVYEPFRIEEASDEDLRSIFAVNVLGAAYCIRSAVPLLRRRGGGDIVNVTSESVASPFPLLTAYAATKGALEVLSRGLRDELRPDNIRVAIFRSGRMTGENASAAHWPPERLRQFMAAIEASGHLSMSGAGVSPEVSAATLVHVLALPREAHVDMLEFRSI